MRGIFGILSLPVTLAIVGVLVKKQLTATSQTMPALVVPAAAGAGAGDTAVQPTGTVKQQSQQIQQQYKQAIDNAMQQARPEPEEK